jgi:proteasome lid subunit RPN8/RPN11
MPREAIGLVGGTIGGVARDIVPLTNLVSGTGAFLADPYEQFCALRCFKADGLELLGIYHSHPGGALDLSSLDAEYGRRWDCAHIVVAVGRPDVRDGECRAFRFGNTGAARAVQLVIED